MQPPFKTVAVRHQAAHVNQKKRIKQMDKRFLTVAAGSLMAIAAWAVPAKPGIHTFTQSDGTTISLELKGDARFHVYVTTDGLPVERDEATGDFRYITPEGLSAVRAHNPGNRTSEEASYLKANSSELTVEKLATYRRTEKMRAQAISTGIQAVKAMQKAQPQVPNNGVARIPVMLISYKDVDFKDGEKARETFEDFFNGTGVSARQYFIDQSNGKYQPHFDIYGPVKMSGNRTVYGANDRWGNDVGAGKMMAEASLALNAEINFADYDNDGDGVCDVIIGLYAGVGEASASNASNTVWPHQWELSASEYGKSLYLDGVTIDKYAVFNELHGDGRDIDGIGTVCHEFSHCLGLPDFYETTYAYGYYGMGNWSLLCAGCYNNDGYTPIGYTAYEKEFMGWISTEEATPNTRYTLPVFNQKNADTDVAIKVTSDNDPDEYFIFENRSRQGWDQYMPADGMLITHVTFDQKAWDSNTVNNSAAQRMCPVPADNKLSTTSESGDLWPGLSNTATSFTDSSRPAAALNGGGYLEKPVTEITRHDDGTISFMFMKGAVHELAAPVLTGHTDVCTTSFTANWTHTENDFDVTYTLEVAPHLDVMQIMSSDFTLSTTDWTTDTSNEYAEFDSGENCFKFGSTKRNGTATSPAFTLDGDGTVTVILEAKSYGSDKAGITVSVLDEAGEATDSKTTDLTTSYARYAFVLQGKPGAENHIKISTTGLKKRFYLRNIDIYSGDASSMSDGTVVRAMDNRDENGRITITGITGTSYTVTGLTEGERYDYRVMAVAADHDVAADSKWSSRNTISLITTGIENVSGDTTGNAVPKYFTLQGIRVDANNLTPGIYIVRRGNTTTKTVIH